MKILTTLLAFSGFMLLHSCTIEKQLYTNGYHISRNQKIKSSASDETTRIMSSLEDLKPITLPINELLPSSQNSPANVTETEETARTESTTTEIIPEAVEKNQPRIQPKQNSSHTVIKTQKNPKAGINKERKERSNNGKALLLFIEAVVFALLGLVFITYFGVFGLVFGIIFYTAAAILLVASVIYLIL